VNGTPTRKNTRKTTRHEKEATVTLYRVGSTRSTTNSLADLGDRLNRSATRGTLQETWPVMNQPLPTTCKETRPNNQSCHSTDPSETPNESPRCLTFFKRLATSGQGENRALVPCGRKRRHVHIPPVPGRTRGWHMRGVFNASRQKIADDHNPLHRERPAGLISCEWAVSAASRQPQPDILRRGAQDSPTWAKMGGGYRHETPDVVGEMAAAIEQTFA
jgi:hypothetical protein